MIQKMVAKKSKKITTNEKKQLNNPNHFTFTEIFRKFETKDGDFRNSFVGFILKDIRETPNKLLVSDWQWFDMAQKFKIAFQNYTDSELLGKQIQFAGIKETHKRLLYLPRQLSD